MEMAIKDGDGDLLVTIYKLHKEDFGKKHPRFGFRNPLRHAATHGRLEILEWLSKQDEKATWLQDPWLLDAALASCKLEVVQWVHKKFCGSNSMIVQTQSLDAVASRGALDLLQWTLSAYPTSELSTDAQQPTAIWRWSSTCTKKWTEGCTTRAMDKAAANGHLEVVKFLHESRTDGCTTRAMNEAASNGHLNLVKFLHEHRKEGCTEKAMNGAAGGGHLEVVRFLHTSRSEGCTEYAMEAAIPHLEVAKYLEDNHCCSGDWSNVAIAAAQTGDLAALRFVCTHHAEDVSAAALLYAGGESLLEMIKIFEEFNVDGWTSTVMDYAAGVGNLDAVRYLHMHRTKGCSTDAMDKAATNAHLEGLRHLHEYRTEGCTKAAMDGAAGAANLEILRFLQKERPDGCTSDAICRAAKSGDIQVLEFILSHYDLSIPETAALSGTKGGHWDILVRLLRLNPPEDHVEISHTLAAEGHLSIIKRLCKASAIDQPIVQSCIVQAAENGHWYVVKFLLSQVTDALLGYDWFTEAIEAASLFAD
ncbi:hypothetical protein Poli38472_010216 [Pythium oligandrum]|uniref:Ankyrin repeat protein n=1 Tax=Pythium oligandrum TaxID=41045 RepID=A0A8K1C8S4_PYTOL|nr:hypothetical protein Poli38472_010216 [Pythium oligandrum]|eukprot:TMW58657.1 hypothetical protein Poli38472_010216 [Pythium oligandrum]